MSDLTERLRVNAKSWRRKDAFQSREQDEEAKLCDEAADRIEALERENAWLRMAMTPIASVALAAGSIWLDTETVDRLPHVGSILRLGYLRAAATALRDAKEREE